MRQTGTFIRRICGPDSLKPAGPEALVNTLQFLKFPWTCKLDNLGPQTMPAKNSVVQDEITIYNNYGWCTVLTVYMYFRNVSTRHFT